MSSVYVVGCNLKDPEVRFECKARASEEQERDTKHRGPLERQRQLADLSNWQTETWPHSTNLPGDPRSSQPGSY